MSADAWRICPQCKHSATAARETKILEVSASYGKIPAPKYLADLEAANKPIQLEETLREDYEVLTDEDGSFYFTYRCGCGKCGFGHTEKIDKLVFKIQPQEVA